eukprot:EG_transcript_19162
METTPHLLQGKAVVPFYPTPKGPCPTTVPQGRMETPPAVPLRRSKTPHPSHLPLQVSPIRLHRVKFRHANCSRGIREPVSLSLFSCFMLPAKRRERLTKDPPPIHREHTYHRSMQCAHLCALTVRRIPPLVPPHSLRRPVTPPGLRALN